MNASGYRLALLFLPMTVLMILASVLTGRWTSATGPRWSITIGCLLLAGGLLLTDAFLSPHPDYPGLIVALALADAAMPDRSGGTADIAAEVIGTTVVPMPMPASASATVSPA